MATNQLRQVIQTLRRATLPPDGAGLTDGQLLESYVRSRGEAAFAALVQRHGPMVWGVCRRVIGGGAQHHDAEDAFQATFLVLVRKAASIVQREKVANWLYGVAHQVALKVRATTAKRRGREKQVTVMPEPAFEPQELWHDLQPLLDRELSRLPDKYRAVIVLCDLEGKTRKEAARHLSLPEGTVASRLATARTMLAKRLRRSTVAVSGGALAAMLAQNGASASVPSSVASSTIQAAVLFAAQPTAATGLVSAKAVALAEGVLKTMLLTKLKIATAVLVMVAVVGLGGTGAAALRQQTRYNPNAEWSASLTPNSVEPLAQPLVAQKEPADQLVKDKKQDEAPARVVSGVVKAVDAAQNILTVAHKEGEDTFTVAKGAKIEIDGKPGRLAGLPTGANITLSQFVDLKSPRSVQANGQWFWGVLLKAVDAEKNTITLEDDDFNKQRDVSGKTFTVAQDANILIDAKPGKLAGIPRGAHLNLGLAADQRTALTLVAEGPYLGGCGGSMVKAIDAEKNTITFGDKGAAEVTGKTFTIGKDTYIVIDGKPGKLAEIPTGSFVNLTLTVDQQAVRCLGAQGPRLSGIVKAVDADKNTITVDDKTFTVAKDGVIVIDGKPGQLKLAELPMGTSVNLTLRVDQKTVGFIQAKAP